MSTKFLAVNEIKNHVLTNKLKYKYKGTRIITFVFRCFFLVGLSFVMLYPILFMFSGAFKSAIDVYDLSVVWLPKNYSLEAMGLALDALDFQNAFIKTLIILVPSVLLQVASSILAAYAFARFKFPFQKLMFVLLIFSIIVPTSSIIIPLFTQFNDYSFLGISGFFGVSINFLNTPVPFYVMAATGFGIRSGLYIFILRQFFSAIPKELEEAALIDGAGNATTFVKVMLPNAVNAIVTVTILSVVWYWNDYYMSAMFLNSNFPLSVQLTMLNSSLVTLADRSSGIASTTLYLLRDSVVESACLVVSAPLIAVYIFFQKYLVESIEKTGIVG